MNFKLICDKHGHELITRNLHRFKEKKTAKKKQLKARKMLFVDYSCI